MFPENVIHAQTLQNPNQINQIDSVMSALINVAILGGVLIAFLLLLVVGIYYWMWRVKFKSRERSLKDKVFLKIQLAEDNEIEPAAAEQMYSSMYGIKRSSRSFFGGFKEAEHISFEIVATHDSIDFYAVCHKSLASLVEKQINAAYPDAEVSHVEPWNIWKKDGYVDFTSLVLKKDNYLPINTYEDMKVDSMAILTAAMSKLHPDEGLAFQMIIRPAEDSWQKNGKTHIKSHMEKHNQTDKEGKPTGPKMSRIDEDYIEKIGNKISKIGFETVIRLVSVSGDEASSKANLSNLERAFGQFNSPNFNHFKDSTNRFEKYFVLSFLARMFPAVEKIELPFEIKGIVKKEIMKTWSILNTEELATLWHLPGENVRTPRINWLRSKGSAAPIELPDSGLYLGLSVFRGQEAKIFMRDDDRRRHMYILGTTGTGKSEFMKFMAIQDIKDGKGVAFIDPHGSAVNDIVQQIPPERLDDVIYFDPSTDRPMGLNILDVKTEKAKDMIINKFLDMLYELYDPNRQGIMGPQLERALRMCMLTAMSQPGGTLIDVVRLLVDENYHKRYMDTVNDPVVRQYWEVEIANTTKNRKGETMGYFVSKLDRFTTEKTMRHMLGQAKSSFDFQDVMDNKKILLADLSKGKLGAENSKFLGLLLVPRLLAAAFARAEKIERGEQIEDFYLYIDEF